MSPTLKETRGKRPMPFPFVFECLYPKEYSVKPMFGCYAIYVGGKICLILRKRKDHPGINGVWLATSIEHHVSLIKEFPSMRSIDVLGKAPTNWQVLPEASEDFEQSVTRACELVVRGDARIGKIPKARKRSATPTSRTRRSSAASR